MIVVFQEMKKNDLESKLTKLQNEVMSDKQRSRLASKASLNTYRQTDSAAISSRIQSAFTREPSNLGSARIDTSRPLSAVGSSAIKIATSLGHTIPQSAGSVSKPLHVQISSHCNVLIGLLGSS